MTVGLTSIGHLKKPKMMKNLSTSGEGGWGPGVSLTVLVLILACKEMIFRKLREEGMILRKLKRQ